MKSLKYLGLGLFLFALGTFIALPLLTRYQVSEAGLEALSPRLDETHRAQVLEALRSKRGEDLGGKFAFLSWSDDVLARANENIERMYRAPVGLVDRYVDSALVAQDGQYLMTETSQQAANQLIPEAFRSTIAGYTGWLQGKGYDSPEAFREKAKGAVEKAFAALIRQNQIGSYQQDLYRFEIAKATATGLFWENQRLFFWLIIGLGVFGGLLYSYPAFFDGLPGIKHNHIYHNSATNAGLIGILTGVFLIGFYVLLYFYHYLIPEWIVLMDPVSYALRGEPASQWFMYGFLYTLAILVMGVRMFAKYRHSRYQQLRTASVMFFQLSFAFLIPHVLYLLNLPEMDLKNIWPLNYTFFFDYNIENHIEAGTIGIFMLVWGIILVVIGVPLLTYIFGKRWYCSWVCGCGGLAETLGDPYRQLSDKSLEAWQIERFLIHGVLVFAVGMTGLVLYSYLSESGVNIEINRWLFLGLVWGLAVVLYGLHRRFYPDLKGRKVAVVLLVFAGALTLGNFTSYFSGSGSSLNFSSYDVRGIYGFAIGSVFAGVVGTGFYPFMGNRVWCRFGCPLAAYLGLVQRFQSRFRITTNGGQCISCGNCSTYCEMGIDVRAYAQRGQNIVRSSCVGCGVCAAVCPRGVLALENGPDTGKNRMEEAPYA